MPEVLNLTTPIAPPARTTYRVSRVTFDWDNAAIRIALRGSDGVIVDVAYDGAPATVLMQALDTANLTTTSLHSRIIQRLQADGFLPAGTISGTPA